jgi:hypothetical protein
VLMKIILIVAALGSRCVLLYTCNWKAQPKWLKSYLCTCCFFVFHPCVLQELNPFLHPAKYQYIDVLLISFLLIITSIFASDIPFVIRITNLV